MKRYLIFTAMGTVVAVVSLLFQIPDFGCEWRIAVQLLGCLAGATFGCFGAYIDMANDRERSDELARGDWP